MSGYVLSKLSILPTLTTDQKKHPYTIPTLINLNAHDVATGGLCGNGSGDGSMCDTGTSAFLCNPGNDPVVG
mgnify:CR=1 FL=1